MNDNKIVSHIGSLPITSSKNKTFWHSRRSIPHYDPGYGYQMITYRLADALPRHVVQEIFNNKTHEKHKLSDVEKYLDRHYGSCILSKPEIAQIVIDNWHWFDEQRYKLHAFVVMPNHVHLLIRVFEGNALSHIIHGWKSYTANRIKQFVRAPTTIWQADYWDRFIRDQDHFNRVVEYIHYNPVKAGICEKPSYWPYSSAFEYKK
ncbi:MAG: transposase [Gammaproteobacteria bacterium]